LTEKYKPYVNEYKANHLAYNNRKKDSEINDFYATEPKAVEDLLKVESFSKQILEPAVGMGHIANVLENNGYEIKSSDIIDRGYKNTEVKDFFDYKENSLDIVTNPPFKLAQKFLEHAQAISTDGVKIALFLKLTWLEGKARGEMFKKYPPKYIYVFSSRRVCARGGDFEKYKSSAVAYCWYIWEVGYKSDPIVKWID
jgi:hypothetical protein